MMTCEQLKGDAGLAGTLRLVAAKSSRKQAGLCAEPESRSAPVMLEASGFALVLLDLGCLILVGLPFFILTPQHAPFKRGFFCADESIRFPLREDTISYQLLGGLMIPFALAVIVCGEYLSVRASGASNQPPASRYLTCVYKAVGSYAFGAAVSQSLTDVAKYSVGRLRPNFLAVCRPVWEGVDCRAGGYVENFTCTGERFQVDEARLSFFSGHSSFAMYSMLFLVLYIQARLTPEWARLLRPTVQFFLLAGAVYVGLSRVSDYKHHWSDVLVGLLLGAVVAVFTVSCVSNSFQQPADPVVSQEEEETRASLQETPPNGINYGSTD